MRTVQRNAGVLAVSGARGSFPAGTVHNRSAQSQCTLWGHPGDGQSVLCVKSFNAGLGDNRTVPADNVAQ